MTGTSNWLIFNLDIELDLFLQIEQQIGGLIGLGQPVARLENLQAGSLQGGQTGLVVLFSRRLDAGGAAMARPLASLKRLDRIIEMQQVRRAFGCVVFVDCGELPGAPLSDFGVIGQFNEVITETLPDAAFAGIYTLDAARGASGDWADGTFTLHDTRSDAFVDHMRDHLVACLQAANAPRSM